MALWSNPCRCNRNSLPGETNRLTTSNSSTWAQGTASRPSPNRASQNVSSPNCRQSSHPNRSGTRCRGRPTGSPPATPAPGPRELPPGPPPTALPKMCPAPTAAKVRTPTDLELAAGGDQPDHHQQLQHLGPGNCLPALPQPRFPKCVQPQLPPKFAPQQIWNSLPGETNRITTSNSSTWAQGTASRPSPNRASQNVSSPNCRQSSHPN